VIDLHLHTTVSDGRLSPQDLVRLAAASGVTVMAVTDHDTTAALSSARACAGPLGVELVSGIEITAVDDEQDVHVLGYFLDESCEELQTFLEKQRDARLARVRAIGTRLDALGLPVDLTTLLEAASRTHGQSLGRPQVARALVAAGHATDVREAFDRWLGRGRPGFVPREGAPAATVIDSIHRARGLASLAHPGPTLPDARLRALRDHGLDAVEVHHPDHDGPTVERLRDLAGRLGLLVTGGSDFHGDPGHGRAPGFVSLPAGAWARLAEARMRLAG
jgi:predicted metal-dependent phosphoesterase TrpH